MCWKCYLSWSIVHVHRHEYHFKVDYTDAIPESVPFRPESVKMIFNIYSYKCILPVHLAIYIYEECCLVAMLYRVIVRNCIHSCLRIMVLQCYYSSANTVT